MDRLPVSQQTSFFRSAPGAPWEIHVHGRSSQELFGEIGLSEIQIVFAEVFICPETMELHQESLRESHFGATVTRFEFPWRIGRKSEMKQVETFPGSYGNSKKTQGREGTGCPLRAGVRRAGQGWDRLGRAGIGWAGEGAI